MGEKTHSSHSWKAYSNCQFQPQRREILFTTRVGNPQMQWKYLHRCLSLGSSDLQFCSTAAGSLGPTFNPLLLLRLRPLQLSSWIPLILEVLFLLRFRPSAGSYVRIAARKHGTKKVDIGMSCFSTFGASFRSNELLRRLCIRLS